MDAVREVLRMDSSTVNRHTGAVAGVERSFVRGVGKRPGSQRMLIVLDVRRVVDVQNAPALA